jgi:hypothetical protein
MKVAMGNALFQIQQCMLKLYTFSYCLTATMKNFTLSLILAFPSLKQLANQ